MNDVILYQNWKTGKEEKYELNLYSSDIEHKTDLICPFDNTPILERSYYHNEHDLFCPNCGETYSPNRTQEWINKQAKNGLFRNRIELIELEKKKAKLEERIKQAEEMGISSK